MARDKILVLAALGILLMSGTAALQLDIQIAALTDHRVSDVNYKQNFSNIQEINASVENVGSIGCHYRLKATLDRKNESFVRYSEDAALWPGDSERLTVYDYPLNYTGTTEAQLQLQYCGQTRNITEFNYTDTENNTVQKEVSSEAVKVTEKQAEIETEAEGLLIPQNVPPYWKAGAEEAVNSSATLDYEPTIFKQGEKLEYLVVNRTTGNAEAYTAVTLDERPPTLKEKLMEKKLQIILTVLLISLTGNLVLLHEKKTAE